LGVIEMLTKKDPLSDNTPVTRLSSRILLGIDGGVELLDFELRD
jgi:hypothetical protein